MKEIKPLEERRKNYEMVRNRIFGDGNVRNKTDEIRKTREKFKQKKQENKLVKQTMHYVSSIGDNKLKDPRAYAEITIGNETIRGLLDSGASISLLGKDCDQVVENIGAKIHTFSNNIRTAGGNNFSIVGKIVVPVKFNEKEQNFTFYLCPDLIQKAYLGVDFWKTFEIAPEIFHAEELDPEILRDYPLDTKNVIEHELTPEMRERLYRAKKRFSTYEENGLGKTRVEQHKIELIEGAQPVKERNYPISPAVQQLIYSEIDEMLRLGVIEECSSPWSNRSTLVRKPEKNRLCHVN